MGTTLANLGPQAGMAAQGFVQGRAAGTQEAQSRQEIALRAAQEGRAKEEHRLGIQQLGLMIQQREQAIRQQEQMFGPSLKSAQGQAAQYDAAPDPYEKTVGGLLGPNFSQHVQPDMTREQYDAAVGAYLRDRGYDIATINANKPRGSEPDVEKQIGIYAAQLGKLASIRPGDPMDAATAAELYKSPDVRNFMSVNPDPQQIAQFIRSRIKRLDPNVDFSMFDAVQGEPPPPDMEKFLQGQVK